MRGWPDLSCRVGGDALPEGQAFACEDEVLVALGEHPGRIVGEALIPDSA